MTAVQIIWGPAACGLYSSTNGYTSHPLSDSDNKFAFKLNFPKDGTVTDLGFYVTAVNGSPPDYNIGLVTLDGTTGFPTTTAYGASAIDTYTPGTTGWKWHTLSSSTTVNSGDYAALHIYPGGTAPTGTNNINVDYALRSSLHDIPEILYYLVNWQPRYAFGLAAIKYDDGDVFGITGTFPGTSTIQSDTTPDEIAAKFQLPVDMKCIGFVISLVSSVAGATYDVILYNSGGTAVKTVSISDEDLIVTNSTGGHIYLYFDEISLTGSSDYRLAIKATEANFGFIPCVFDFDATTDLSQNLLISEAANWSYSERTDSGAWSDDASKLPAFGLIISDITFSTTTGVGQYGWAS